MDSKTRRISGVLDCWLENKKLPKPSSSSASSASTQPSSTSSSSSSSSLPLKQRNDHEAAVVGETELRLSTATNISDSSPSKGRTPTKRKTPKHDEEAFAANSANSASAAVGKPGGVEDRHKLKLKSNSIKTETPKSAATSGVKKRKRLFKSKKLSDDDYDDKDDDDDDARNVYNDDDDADDDDDDVKQLQPKRKRIQLKASTERESPSTPSSNRHCERIQGKLTVNLNSEITPSSSRRPPSSSPSNSTAAGSLPLSGFKIVLTGVFDSMSREEMENHIKRMGGQLTTAVSGKTSTLIYGSILEDGREVTEGNKYRTAVALRDGTKLDGKPTKPSNIFIMSESEFLKKHPPATATAAAAIKAAVNYEDGRKKGFIEPELTAEAAGGPRPALAKRTSEKAAEGRLWFEKWRPKRLEDLLGNNETIRKLVSWLKDWHEICITKTVKPAPSKNRFSEFEKSNAKAALLSGPPGIGKTTAARLAANICGYEALEFNASDDRGKAIFDNLNDMTSGGQSILSFVSKDAPKNVVLIMDEVDGVGGNSDRGGVQALIKLIDKTCCPVICICNDRMSTKIRSLANKCYDLRFIKPAKPIITKRIMEICKEEGLNVEYNAIQLLCESVSNDIRQMFNMLQLMKHDDRLINANLTFDGMKREIGFGIKDNQVMTNFFDCARKALTRADVANTTMNDKLDLFFVDYDMMPLMMQENYIAAFDSSSSNYQQASAVTSTAAAAKSKIVQQSTFSTIAEVGDCFTFADILNMKCVKGGHWNLLGDIGFFSTVVPSAVTAGFLRRPEFPKWLGRNSTKSKNKRLLNELLLYIAPHTTSTSIATITSGYLSLLYERILSPLRDCSSSEDMKEQSQRCVRLMDEYGVSREHVVENMGSLRLTNEVKLFDKLDSSAKRCLTNTYNSATHAIRIFPPSLVAATRRASSSGTATTAARGLPSNEVEECGADEGSAPVKDAAAVSGSTEEEEQQKNLEGTDEEAEGKIDRLFIRSSKKKGSAAASSSTRKSTGAAAAGAASKKTTAKTATPKQPRQKTASSTKKQKS